MLKHVLFTYIKLKLKWIYLFLGSKIKHKERTTLSESLIQFFCSTQILKAENRSFLTVYGMCMVLFSCLNQPFVLVCIEYSIDVVMSIARVRQCRGSFIRYNQSFLLKIQSQSFPISFSHHVFPFLRLAPIQDPVRFFYFSFSYFLKNQKREKYVCCQSFLD